MAKLNRFNGWVAVIAFSCVVLGSFIEDVPNSFRNQKENYVIACCSIAIALSAVVLSGYFFFEKMVGTLFEAAIGTVVFALWAAAIAVLQNPDNQLALTAFPAIKSVVIRNANLYFFSWASFVSTAYVIASLGQEHEVVNIQAVPMKLMRWYLLLITSIVLLGVSSKVRDLTCSSICPDGTNACFDSELCRRTNYGVSLGVISAALSIIPITLAHLGSLKPIIEIPVAFVALVFYCVGAAAITDNASGPGNTIGNLYFASWIGFGLTVLLFCTSIKEMVSPDQAESSEGENVESEGKDVKGGGEVKPGKGNNRNVVQNVGEHVEETPAEEEEA